MNKGKVNIEQVKLLRKGNIAAFDAIYNQYCHKLHQFVFMYLKQEEDAEGIVQEVFIKIWQSRSKINLYSSFESFLFTIAYNSAMSLLRKRLSEEKSKNYIKSLQKVNSSEQVIDEIHFKDLNQRVMVLLDQCTPRQKEVYLLSREEGLTHEEIAKKLNISESTVNNHLVTILKFLKKRISSGLAINALFVFLFLS